MLDDNKIIQSLWIGEKLENLELLTLKSFVAQGHEFHLYTYSEIKTPIPKGVLLKDANSIITKDKIFTYKSKNEYGHGKGSYAGFSDIFRYKLLYEKGGWWVDMDVTCLQYFDIKTPYFFRKHEQFLVVNNVIKCPPKSAFMERCYKQTIVKISPENRTWMLPSAILSDNVTMFNLEKYINDNTTNLDIWKQIQIYLFAKKTMINKRFIALHWMNERWRSEHMNKAEAVSNSLYAQLLQSHSLTYLPIESTLFYFQLLKIKLYLFIYKIMGSRFRGILKRVIHSFKNGIS